MANIAVYVDLRAGRPSRPTLFAVAEARRVADALGATVYAVAGVDGTAAAGADELARTLGRAGADRVIVCVDPVLGGPPLATTQGRLLDLVAARLKPKLWVFPAGGPGLALGAYVAGRRQAALGARCRLLVEEPVDGGESALVLRTELPAASARVLRIGPEHAAVVATLLAGAAPAAVGAGDAELEELAYPTSVGGVVEDLGAVNEGMGSDERVELARVLLVVGGVPAAELDALARALPEDAAVVDATAPWPAALFDAAPETVLLVPAGPIPPPPSSVAGAEVILVGTRTPSGWSTPQLTWKTPPSDALGALALAFLRGGGRAGGSPP